MLQLYLGQKLRSEGLLDRVIGPGGPLQSRVSDREDLAPPFLSAVEERANPPETRGGHCCCLQMGGFGGLGDAHLDDVADLWLP